jgi:hypothetical protein
MAAVMLHVACRVVLIGQAVELIIRVHGLITDSTSTAFHRLICAIAPLIVGPGEPRAAGGIIGRRRERQKAVDVS